MWVIQQTQTLARPMSQQAGPERRWCHLRIMGKECSQPFSVPIVSDVEEMEELWVVASLHWPWGGGGRGRRRVGGMKERR